MFIKYILILVLILICFSFCSISHPGPTNSDGGHWDKSTGSLHYHNKKPYQIPKFDESSSSSNNKKNENYKWNKNSQKNEQKPWLDDNVFDIPNK